eukprot:scpid89592/ scgid9853/ 
MEMMQMMKKAEAEECVENVIKCLMPAVVQGFWYGLACSSVRTQADSTLLKNKGDLEAAIGEALCNQSENLDSWSNLLSLKKGRVDACLNQCGVSPSHFRPLWKRLRSLALVACLYGIDVNDAAIQGEIVLCLVEAEIKQVPAEILRNDAASIAARLLLQQVEVTGTGLVSLTGIHRLLADTSEDARSRRRAAEYFRARHHELQGARLLEESTKVTSYTEQQTKREQARREFTIAGLPHRIQAVEDETLRQHKNLQSRARVRSAFGLLFSLTYYLITTSLALSRCALVLLFSSLLKVYRFVDYRQYAVGARRTNSVSLPDAEIGLG